jgi:outer membrane immunogenic protein
MKRIFIMVMLSIVGVGPTIAADLPPPPPGPASYAPVMWPVYNWGGVYVGINGGYGFGSSTWTDPLNAFGSTGSFSTDGFLIGGTVGANFQWERLVLGIEGDFDWQSLKGTSSSSFCTGVFAPGAAVAAGAGCQTQSDWLGTIRGRIGYAADRFLLFVTGGTAFGNVQAGLNALSSQSATEFGWTAGVGAEWAFADNWTAKIEYLYVDLGNTTCNTGAACGFNAPAPAIVANDSVKFTESVVRLGVNFKFRPQ